MLWLVLCGKNQTSQLQAVKILEHSHLEEIYIIIEHFFASLEIINKYIDLFNQCCDTV